MDENEKKEIGRIHKYQDREQWPRLIMSFAMMILGLVALIVLLMMKLPKLD